MTFRDLLLAHLNVVLFCAKVAFIWTVSSYNWPVLPITDSSNALTKVPPILWRLRWALLGKGALLSFVVSWFSGWHVFVGLFTFAAAVLLPLARRRIATKYLAELEIGANLSYLVGVAALAALDPQSLTDCVWLGLSNRQVAAVFYIASIAVFILRGGTNIVRGVLEKGHTVPGHAAIRTEVPEDGKPEPILDVNEYNRGRIIGNIERLMLMAFVALQAYQALAFLLTAKGFLRSKDLEQIDFAEYFLVGTLISSCIAIAAGLGVQLVLKVLW